jgi:hypothetical protein
MRHFSPYVTHILPFAVFALLTILPDFAHISQNLAYPLKTVVVGGMLVFFWSSISQEITIQWDWLAVIAGGLVFVLWVSLEGYYPQLGSPKTISPWSMSGPLSPEVFIGFRIVGASLVVPIMEELFWRSFALRFVIDSKIRSVQLGTFTWFSFILVSLAFGFEHHRWLPGILAGMAYAALLYRTRNLFSPILAHAVTNFLLSIYVFGTAQWQYM